MATPPAASGLPTDEEHEKAVVAVNSYKSLGQHELAKKWAHFMCHRYQEAKEHIRSAFWASELKMIAEKEGRQAEVDLWTRWLQDMQPFVDKAKAAAAAAAAPLQQQQPSHPQQQPPLSLPAPAAVPAWPQAAQLLPLPVGAPMLDVGGLSMLSMGVMPMGALPQPQLQPPMQTAVTPAAIHPTSIGMPPNVAQIQAVAAKGGVDPWNGMPMPRPADTMPRSNSSSSIINSSTGNLPSGMLMGNRGGGGGGGGALPALSPAPDVPVVGAPAPPPAGLSVASQLEFIIKMVKDDVLARASQGNAQRQRAEEWVTLIKQRLLPVLGTWTPATTVGAPQATAPEPVKQVAQGIIKQFYTHQLDAFKRMVPSAPLPPGRRNHVWIQTPGNADAQRVLNTLACGHAMASNFMVVPHGMRYVPDVLPVAEQQQLLAAIDNEVVDWEVRPSCQSKQYGYRFQDNQPKPTRGESFPHWASHLLDRLRQEAMVDADVKPNYVVIDVYAPGQGLSPQAQPAVCADSVISVSLGSPATVALVNVSDTNAAHTGGAPIDSCVHVLVHPGSVLSLKGLARHHWTSAMPPSDLDLTELGALYARERRLVITYRVVDERKVANLPDDPPPALATGPPPQLATGPPPALATGPPPTLNAAAPTQGRGRGAHPPAGRGGKGSAATHSAATSPYHTTPPPAAVAGRGRGVATGAPPPTRTHARPAGTATNPEYMPAPVMGRGRGEAKYY